jgi:hypothetical protein
MELELDHLSLTKENTLYRFVASVVIFFLSMASLVHNPRINNRTFVSLFNCNHFALLFTT